MQISCQCCGDQHEFLVPMWCRVTFKITDEGTVNILHIKHLECLEEKLTSHGKEAFYITCAQCGSEADINFNAYESVSEEKSLKKALEGL